LTLFDPLILAHGPSWKNRFVLAPMTNLQSHADGRLSDDEFRWLTLRAQGGFAVTMTCAAHVQAVGQGFRGQLGVWSDDHVPGLTRLATAIKAAGSVASLQLHHAGERAAREIVPEPVAPSADPEKGVRGLSTGEVEQLIEDFILAAQRAERAGFDGVEIHGAHGYVLTQFLSPRSNRREDEWGGALHNRMRPIFAILEGIRSRCRPDFQIGLRLSPERFGLKLAEIVETARAFLDDGRIDFLDMSLWDAGKEPEEEAFKGRSLMSYFTELDRGRVRLGVAGKIYDGATVAGLLSQGADYVLIGRAAILHHDFPERVRADPDFASTSLPVSPAHLAKEGLSPTFIDYMKTWPGFVEAA
jgi:2,4-dienoyl-CoA reductase-like NADH-dependent reductase (Old Yellow Enzyme family)